MTNAAIGIKFVGQGTAMASAEVAGVVAQSNWNNASGTTSSYSVGIVKPDRRKLGCDGNVDHEWDLETAHHG